MGTELEGVKLYPVKDCELDVGGCEEEVEDGGEDVMVELVAAELELGGASMLGLVELEAVVAPVPRGTVLLEKYFGRS